MAFIYTHIAIPKSRRAKIELCLNGPIHFGSGAVANGSTHSVLLQTQVVDFCQRAIRFRQSPSWLLFALGAAAVGLLVYFLYVRPGYRINSKSKIGLIGLRAALLAMLLILLMRPVIVVPSIIPKSASVAVIVDDSRSMQLNDENVGCRVPGSSSMRVIRTAAPWSTDCCRWPTISMLRNYEDPRLHAGARSADRGHDWRRPRSARAGVVGLRRG